jgi:hypothetical protein
VPIAKHIHSQDASSEYSHIQLTQPLLAEEQFRMHFGVVKAKSVENRYKDYVILVVLPRAMVMQQ